MTALFSMSPGRAQRELVPAGEVTPHSGGDSAGAEAQGLVSGTAALAARHGHRLARDLPAIPGLNLSCSLVYLPGRDQIYLRVLQRFVELYEHGYPALAAALANRRWAQACAQLHSLRGACGAIGATELSAQAGALEQTLGGLVDGQALTVHAPASGGIMSGAGDATQADPLHRVSALQTDLAALVLAIQDGVTAARQP